MSARMVLDKISAPMGAQYLSSIGLGFGTLVGKAHALPIPALGKNQSPTSTVGLQSFVEEAVRLKLLQRIFVQWPQAQGQKSIHHHCGTPPLSACRPTPMSQSKKSHGVHHFLGKTREKGIHYASWGPIYAYLLGASREPRQLKP